jgi:hypothetical protein
MVSRRVTCLVAGAAAGLAGCRQLFGIDDTQVVTDARSPDAPTTSSDATPDGGGNQPDGRFGPDGGIDAPPALCPITYTLQHGGHFYRSTAFDAMWQVASDNCAADGANTHLAIPDDEAENTAIAQWVANHAWIGISDIAVEGFYRTVLDAPPAYTNWDGGTPPFEIDQDCVSIESAATGSTWQTDKCDLNRPFVCECE